MRKHKSSTISRLCGRKTWPFKEKESHIKRLYKHGNPSKKRTRSSRLICIARSGPSAATGPRGTITFYWRTNKNVCRSLEAIGCRRHGGPSQQVDDELWPPRSRGRNPILWVFSENALRAALHCKCAFEIRKFGKVSEAFPRRRWCGGARRPVR